MRRASIVISAAAVVAAVASSLSHAASPLLTEAERSGFKITGRYEEVVRLCGEFQRRYSGRARCFQFGETPEGRPMMALSASQDGALSPAAARARKRPVVMIQGGIHAGEIDGKDAGFWALREWLDAADGPLSKVTVLFVPVVNIDGHERFGPHNRPNQTGPEQMGWRTTGQNLNLNRDYVKAEAPEMQAMLRLMGEWDPIVLADLHVTDGAQFQHVISINVLPSHLARTVPLALPWEKSLIEAGYRLEQDLADGLKKDGHLPLTVYPSFVDDNDVPDSGIKDNVSPPRYSEGYWSLHHRIGILVEMHSWKDYATRVRAAHDALRHLVTLAARDGATWLAAARDADEGATRGAAGQIVALAYSNTSASHLIDFLGYAHRREENSFVSCKARMVYDVSHKETWRVRLFDELEVKEDQQVTLPQGGYVVPAAHAAWVAHKLALHGIRFDVLKQSVAAAPVEIYRASETRFGQQERRKSCDGSPIAGGQMLPNEGRQMLKVKGKWAADTRPIDKGSLFVPIAQPHALLVAHLFEPTAPDSLLAWGFFNAAFERAEYMEDYVAEDVAREMLEKDPNIKAAFERKLQDPQFSNDPAARLEFFYRCHPSWDERFNLYPVLRVGAPPTQPGPPSSLKASRFDCLQ